MNFIIPLQNDASDSNEDPEDDSWKPAEDKKTKKGHGQKARDEISSQNDPNLYNLTPLKRYVTEDDAKY